MTQNREGLPPALLEEKRFFPLRGSGKTDTPAGWNDPNNWQYLDDIPEERNFGFAIGGKNSSYLFIDFDHVINNGVLDPRAKEVYKRITKCGETYTERSLSGSGLHMVCDLGDLADSFEPVGNGAQEVILWENPTEYSKLPKEQRDAIPKIEFFYRQAGRYAYLTGRNNRVIDVARDEAAAAMFRELLTIRDENHKQYGVAEAVQETNDLHVDANVLNEIKVALPYISAADYEIWVRVGQACRNIGVPFEVWDEWSQYADMRSGELYPNYNQEETASKWKSFKGTRWNAGTIFRLAIDNGYGARSSDQGEQPAAGTLGAVFGSGSVVDVLADQAEPIPEKEWVVEGLCTVGECAIVAGASKSGKSYLMTGLCIAAASGGVWLDKFPCKRSRVLYINGENAKDDARRRFHAVFEAMAVDPAACEQITMVCADGIVKPVQELREMLINEIRANNYGVVILDPLYMLYKGSEIDEQDAKSFVACIKEICRETGAVLFCVHHHSKGAAVYRNASNRASGSGMLQRAFSTLIDLSEITGDDVAALPEGQRAFELSGQPRQAAGFVENLIFEFPVWRSDAAGLLPSNARNRARTAAARANNKNLQKAGEVARLLPVMIKRAFDEKAKKDDAGDYVTLGDVLEEFQADGINTSERAIGRKLDDGIDGYVRDETTGKKRRIRAQEFKTNLGDCWRGF